MSSELLHPQILYDYTEGVAPAIATKPKPSLRSSMDAALPDVGCNKPINRGV
jgi:hypothetical protein